MSLRFLVVEGNKREARERHRATFGLTPAESYSAVLRSLEPEAICDIALPADDGANLPDPSGLASYDGVVLTGSGLHIYELEPAVTRQVDLARAVYDSGTPFFGSCWGLQVATVAAGGVVSANMRGREVGFARNIAPTAAGASHPLLAGRSPAYDAPAIHLDEVTTLPPGEVTLLASNGMSVVQAAEIRHGGGVFWGVQYHPEFSLGEVAVILGRYLPILLEEGLFRGEAEHAAYIADLKALAQDVSRRDLAWRYGLGDDILDAERRLLEIRNFITHRVRPEQSRRGRA
jgi:GMP synthase (glutamine-hydrolysing)